MSVPVLHNHLAYRSDNRYAKCCTSSLNWGTINISDDEIERREDYNKAHDCAIYINLNDKFFDKISDSYKRAKQQIHSFGSKGLVYIIIKFEDFDHYDRYIEQLATYKKEQKLDDLFFKSFIELIS